MAILREGITIGNNYVDEIRRLDILRLSDFIYYIKDYLPSYFESINLSDLNLTKEYLFNKKVKNNIRKNNVEKFLVNEISIEEESLDDNHFSKEVSSVIEKNEYDLMKYGTYIHEILEYLDFNNIDLDGINDKYVLNKIKSLLNNPLFENISNSKIYKEYEFNYIKDNIEYNGVIDLMLEYDDHIDIVDYKLKNIDDEKYIKQLSGYKDYITSKSNKRVNLYLYSIMDEIVKQIS